MNFARWFAVFLTIFISVLIQPVVLARLNFPGATVDLILVIVCAWALAKGPIVGATAGFVAGILMDLTPPALAIFGLNSIALVLIGYVVGKIGVKPNKSFARPLLTIAAAGIILILIRSVLVSIFETTVAFSRIWELFITQAIYVSLLSIFVVPLIIWLDRKLGPTSRIDELRI